MKAASQTAPADKADRNKPHATPPAHPPAADAPTTAHHSNEAPALEPLTPPEPPPAPSRDTNKNPFSSEHSTTPTPAPKPPAVIPPEFLEHTLAPGETYATLSLKYYGTAAYATSIAKANPLVSPTSLKPGRSLRIPKDPKNVQGLPVREPGTTPKGPTTTYTVVQGDSLSTISQRLYGESKHAKLIYEANRATMKNEHSLKVGQKLVIPPKPAQ